MKKIDTIKEAWRNCGYKPVALYCLGVLLLGLAVLAGAGKARMMGVLLWYSAAAGLWMVGRNSCIHTRTLSDAGRAGKLIILLLVMALILLCVLPMGVSPLWSSKIPSHRDQYERLTEAFLEGHLYMECGTDPRLFEMENPYDPEMRKDLGVECPWDHAFYNGKFYMYFGVVPVFLAFMPYRLLTGTALSGYQATQIFTAIGIVGVFVLLRLLAKVFFKKMSAGMYASLASALSLISLWYSSTTAALYCTAVSSAIMLMIWCLYFFTKAVWDTPPDQVNKQILLAFWGSWCGALAFGCRPTVALVNLMVLPLLVTFLKQHKMTWKLAGKLVLAALPYVAVAAALMAYNYARFEDPFEFGQTYQLTIADQTNYANPLERFDPVYIINGIRQIFLEVNPLSHSFPYLRFSGVLINFPILAMGFGFCFAPVREMIKKHGLTGWTAMLPVTALIIAGSVVQWSPMLVERYRMDVYFVMALLCFTVAGFWDMSLETEERRIRFSRTVSVLSLLTVVSCCWFWFIPQDANAAQQVPGLLDAVKRIVFLDLL